MEGQLLVEPEKLISTSTEFDTTGGQVKSITDNMLSIVKALNSSWVGEAATAYQSKFNELEDDMNRIYSMISEHVRDLQEMAGVYQQAEAKNVEESSGLPGDVIA